MNSIAISMIALKYPVAAQKGGEGSGNISGRCGDTRSGTGESGGVLLVSDEFIVSIDRILVCSLRHAVTRAGQ